MGEEYISKNAALACIEGWQDCKNGDIYPPDETVEWQRIEALPAENVRENVPGQWVQTVTAHMEGTVSIAPRWGCSCCGREFLFDPVKAHFLFCPECGADNMMEEDDEQKNGEQKN